MSADISQDIAPTFSTQGRPRSGRRLLTQQMSRLLTQQMSCLLTQQMSCLLTQQMSCLQTQQMSCLQTQKRAGWGLGPELGLDLGGPGQGQAQTQKP